VGEGDVKPPEPAKAGGGGVQITVALIGALGLIVVALISLRRPEGKPVEIVLPASPTPLPLAPSAPVPSPPKNASPPSPAPAFPSPTAAGAETSGVAAANPTPQSQSSATIPTKDVWRERRHNLEAVLGRAWSEPLSHTEGIPGRDYREIEVVHALAPESGDHCLLAYLVTLHKPDGTRKQARFAADLRKVHLGSQFGRQNGYHGTVGIEDCDYFDAPACVSFEVDDPGDGESITEDGKARVIEGGKCLLLPTGSDSEASELVEALAPIIDGCHQGQGGKQ